MCEKRRWCKFYIFWLYFGIHFFQIGVFLGNFEYRNVFFFIGCPIPFKYRVFRRWFSLSWITVCCLNLWICFRLSSVSILKVPYLLHKDLRALLSPTNHPRTKLEKTQFNNSLESSLKELVWKFCYNHS